MKKSKIRYTNLVNLSGLYSRKLIQCKQRNGEFGYWDTSGNIDANNPGWHIQDGVIQFTSSKYEDVKLWTRGALSAMLFLEKWSETKLKRRR